MSISYNTTIQINSKITDEQFIEIMEKSHVTTFREDKFDFSTYVTRYDVGKRWFNLDTKYKNTGPEFPTKEAGNLLEPLEYKTIFWNDSDWSTNYVTVFKNNQISEKYKEVLVSEEPIVWEKREYDEKELG